MMKKDKCIWMIADGGIGSETGYSRRILMELQLIYPIYGRTVLIYPSGVKLPQEYNEYVQPVPIALKNPMVSQGRILARFLSELAARNGKPNLIYGQNLIAAYLGSIYAKKAGVPLVFDYHGVVPTEAKYKYPGLKGLIAWLGYKIVESRTLKRASLIVTVSENFSKYLGANFRITTLPMLPAEDFTDNHGITRHSITKESLGIQAEAVVFCYLGQAQYWQLSGLTLDLYRRIENRYQNTHLLVISKDLEHFEQAIKVRKIRNYTIKTLKHCEVPAYLDLCDYGFVLRSASLINQVASPTKVMEYLSRGVIPVLTEYVGDYSNILANSGLGVIIPYKVLAHIDDNSFEVEDFFIDLKQRKIKNGPFLATYRERYLNQYLEQIRSITDRPIPAKGRKGAANAGK